MIQWRSLLPTAADQPRVRVCLILRRVQAIVILSVISHITRRSTAHSVSYKQEPQEPSCDRMAALQYIFPSTTEINWETVIEWVLRPPFVYLSADYTFTSVGHSIEDIPRLRAPGYLHVCPTSGTLFRPCVPCPETLKMLRTSGRAEPGVLQSEPDESELDYELHSSQNGTGLLLLVPDLGVSIL